MVAIFTGAGAGFQRGSANILGGAGQIGNSALGRASESVSVNAATGNLLISRQDEFLVGLGPDVGISRAYNSLQDAADGDNGDHWQQSTTRRVFGLTGTLNASGSTIRRLSGDGSVITYSWNAAASAYVTSDGEGAFDKLTNTAGVWTWTDGDTRVTETYSAHGTGNWRIVARTDQDGNALAFTYVGDKLDKVTTADGGWTQYVWSGNNIAQIVTGYTDLQTSTSETLTRVRYAYDGSHRLVSATTDLSPEDSSVVDGETYLVTYTYDGASNRVASIAQSDGSHLAITYDGSGRVQTLTQLVATGVSRVTTLSYGTGYSEVTGPDGKVTRLDYDSAGQLTKITAPPATNGATAQTVLFGYDAQGNVISITDGKGKVTEYDHDSSGNVILVTDANGDTIQRTYDSSNRLITELTYGADETGPSAAHYTQYAYDGEGHLRFAVNAAGQVTEYEYTSAGQLLRTIRYPEQGYAVGPGAITEAGMESWAAGLGSLASVQITENAYDARGNLLSVTSFGAANASGVALTGEGTSKTHNVYDQAGRLLERHSEGENSESYVYDGMGRLVASSDVNGGTTTIVFNDAASTTTVTSALGYTTDFSYNTMGRLIEKKSPQVAIVTEAGLTQNVRPVETYYYDASGRLVAQKDANGNLTKLTLLAGTGYGGGQALVTQVIQAGGGTVTTQYDVHGNARKITDQIGRVTNQTFDAMGRVLTVARQGAAVQNYTYDQQGRQVKHWNSVHGSSDAEISKYDIQGWVAASRNFGGEVTNTAYAWNDTASTSAIGNFGGWIQTVTADGYTLATATDLFGRRAGADYTYDTAGRLSVNQTDPNVAGQINYQYYNTGNLRYKHETSFVTDEVLAGFYLDTASKEAWFSYDELGRLKTEKLTTHKLENFEFSSGAPGEPETEWLSDDFGDTFQDSTATYDALGRLVSLHDNYGNFDKSWAYDANGNVRKIVGSHSGTTSTTEWYRYDALNRVTLAKGDLVSGVIVRGSDGISLTYDAASQRASSQTGSAALEYYTYNDLGLVSEVRIGSPTGTARVTSSYDTLGRLNGHIEKDAAGNVVYERFDIQYNSRNQILREKSRVHQDTGDWIYNHTVNHYNDTGHSTTASDPALITGSSSTGSSSGNLLYFSRTKSWVNGTVVSGTGTPGYGSAADNSLTDAASEHHYEWHDDKGFLETIIATTNQYGSGSTSQEYDGAGNIVDADRTNGPWGEKENFRYATDAYGQIISREEYDDTQHYAVLGLPSTHTYRFGGREIGIVSNDGTDNVDYATLISHRDDTGSGSFRYGSNVPTNYSDFDSNHVTMAAGAQGETPGSYMAQGGESLQDVAAVVWGDANLWYKLAEANGISGGVLQAGQRLVIPNGVVGIHNNADTIKPYDPSRALGDINPPHVSPPRTAGGDGCGVFGQILVAAVSIAVTAIAPISGGWLAQIGNGLLGNIAGQVAGVATGVQDGFSFKSLALAGVSTGVAVGLKELAGASGALGKVLDGGTLAGNAATGAVSSAITQGIGVTAGLQDKFSWAGVAAAGVSAGIGQALGGNLKPLHGNGSNGSLGNILAHTGVGTASLIASAATRSAIEGSSFGDNIMAGLPDVIGQVLGRSLATAVTGPEISQPQQGFGPGWEQTEDGNWVNRAAIDRAIAELGNPVTQNGGVDTVGENMKVDVSAFGIGGVVSEQVAQNSRVYRTGLSSTLGDKGIATAERSTNYSQFSDEMQAELVHGFAQAGKSANGRWLQDFLTGLYERHGIDGTVQSVDDLQAVVDAVAAGSAIPRGQIRTVNGVSEYAQALGTFAQSPTGTFTYNYVNDMAFGVPGALFDHEGGLEIMSERNPYSAIAGQAVAFAAGLAAGGSSLAIKAETSTLRLSSGAAESGVWKLGPGPRGETLEQMLGHNLPGNFPIVDRFENGIATSIKSIDLDAASYLSGNGLRNTLTRYVDKVAGFNGANWADAIIRPNQITARSLEVVVPHGGTAAQQAAIADVVRYGSTQNVAVKVIPVP